MEEASGLLGITGLLRRKPKQLSGLDIATGKNFLTALVDGDVEVKPHQDIDLDLNIENIHLFRKEGGEAII